jgi:transcriptional regulator with XRE-family HTH domain
MADGSAPIPWDGLTKLRLDAGLSITELAAQSRVSRPYLSQLESGTRRGRPAYVKRVADVLSRRLGRQITVTDLEATRPAVTREVA